jgi:mitochondrial import inner membrane translocase subunit TIM44
MRNIRAIASISEKAKIRSYTYNSISRNALFIKRSNGLALQNTSSWFSSSAQDDKKSKASLRDTVNRLKEESGSNESNGSTSSETSYEMFVKLADAWSSFRTGVSEAWTELIHSNKPKDINKKIHDVKPPSAADDDNAAADKYEGTTAIMIVNEEDHLNAFERMQKRLSEAPVIQSILSAGEDLYEKTGAKKIKEKIDHAKEDAREAFETSQNPWVYRVSSIYETITEESESAMAERKLQELDPEFSLEQFKINAVEVTLPKFMKLFLEGKVKDLKPHLGEAVYNKFAAEARARKKEGVYVDTNVLGIMNSEILSCSPGTVDNDSPIILMHFMCQQINCVRKYETGEIVEGSEDDIKAYSYVAAFQREYNEENGELNWKIIEFMMNGAIAYL